MKERIEMNSNELEGVVGGAITWRPNGECFDRDHPDTVYHFDVSRFDEIQIYIRQHNGGRAQDIQTLRMLESAGYVW